MNDSAAMTTKEPSSSTFGELSQGTPTSLTGRQVRQSPLHRGSSDFGGEADAFQERPETPDNGEQSFYVKVGPFYVSAILSPEDSSTAYFEDTWHSWSTDIPKEPVKRARVKNPEPNGNESSNPYYYIFFDGAIVKLDCPCPVPSIESTQTSSANI